MRQTHARNGSEPVPVSGAGPIKGVMGSAEPRLEPTLVPLARLQVVLDVLDEVGVLAGPVSGAR